MNKRATDVNPQSFHDRVIFPLAVMHRIIPANPIFSSLAIASCIIVTASCSNSGPSAKDYKAYLEKEIPSFWQIKDFSIEEKEVSEQAGRTVVEVDFIAAILARDNTFVAADPLSNLQEKYLTNVSRIEPLHTKGSEYSISGKLTATEFGETWDVNFDIQQRTEVYVVGQFTEDFSGEIVIKGSPEELDLIEKVDQKVELDRDLISRLFRDDNEIVLSRKSGDEDREITLIITQTSEDGKSFEGVSKDATKDALRNAVGPAFSALVDGPDRKIFGYIDYENNSIIIEEKVDSLGILITDIVYSLNVYDGKLRGQWAYDSSFNTNSIEGDVILLESSSLPEPSMTNEVNSNPETPTGNFLNDSWRVSLSGDGESYQYLGVNLESGDELRLSDGNPSGTTEEKSIIWLNGDYKYQISWLPSDLNLIRLQVFSPSNEELLNETLTKD